MTLITNWQSNYRFYKKKGWNYKGCAEIVMPENYIALFGAPEEAEYHRGCSMTRSIQCISIAE